MGAMTDENLEICQNNSYLLKPPLDAFFPLQHQSCRVCCFYYFTNFRHVYESDHNWTDNTIFSSFFWKKQKDSGQTLICLKSLVELTKDELTRSNFRFLTKTVLAGICFLQSDSLLPKRRNISSNQNHCRSPKYFKLMDGYSWRLDMFKNVI